MIFVRYFKPLPLRTGLAATIIERIDFDIEFSLPRGVIDQGSMFHILIAASSFTSPLATILASRAGR